LHTCAFGKSIDPSQVRLKGILKVFFKSKAAQSQQSGARTGVIFATAFINNFKKGDYGKFEPDWIG
jgi:hypothetical protein